MGGNGRNIFNIAMDLNGVLARLVLILPEKAFFFDLITARLTIDHDGDFPDTTIGLAHDKRNRAVPAFFVGDIGIAVYLPLCPT